MYAQQKYSNITVGSIKFQRRIDRKCVTVTLPEARRLKQEDMQRRVLTCLKEDRKSKLEGKKLILIYMLLHIYYYETVFQQNCKIFGYHFL